MLSPIPTEPSTGSALSGTDSTAYVWYKDGWMIGYLAMLVAGTLLNGLMTHKEKLAEVIIAALALFALGLVLAPRIPRAWNYVPSIFAFWLDATGIAIIQGLGFNLAVGRKFPALGNLTAGITLILLILGLPLLFFYKRRVMGLNPPETPVEFFTFWSTGNPWLFGLMAGVPLVFLKSYLNAPDLLEKIAVQSAGLAGLIVGTYLILPRYFVRPPDKSRWQSSIWYFWYLLMSYKPTEPWPVNAVWTGLVLLIMGVICEVCRQTDRSRPWDRPFQDILLYAGESPRPL